MLGLGMDMGLGLEMWDLNMRICVDTGWDMGKWDIYRMGCGYGMDLASVWEEYGRGLG